MSLSLEAIQKHFKRLGKPIYVSQLADSQANDLEIASTGLLAQEEIATADGYSSAAASAVPLFGNLSTSIKATATTKAKAQAAVASQVQQVIAVDLGLNAGASITTVCTALSARMQAVGAYLPIGNPNGFASYFANTFSITLPTSGSPTILDDWITAEVVSDSFDPTPPNSVLAANITDATAPGRTLLMAASASAQRTALGLGNVATLSTGTSQGNIPILGSGGLLPSGVIPTVSVIAANITDATSAGRALLTAANTAAQTTALGLGTASVRNTGAAAGNIPVLDGSGKLPSAAIPETQIVNFLGTAADQTAMLLLTGNHGDFCVRLDEGKNWIITGDDTTQLSSWTSLAYPTAPVLTVAGQTGTVVLGSTDISDSTTAGRALLTATDVSTQHTALGLGTAAFLNVGLGYNNIPILDNDGLLNPSTIPPSAAVTISSISDATTIGKSLLAAEDAAALQTILELGTLAELNVGNGSGEVPALGGDGKFSTNVIPAITITSTQISNATEIGLALITAADTASAATTLGLGTAATHNTGTGSGNIPILDGDGLLAVGVLPNITIPAANISDSTTAGQALITAASVPAQRTALGLGTAATHDTGTGSGNIPVLDGDGKLTTGMIPALNIVNFLGTAADQTAMLLLTGNKGDFCVRLDNGMNYVLTGNDPTSAGSWTSLSYPTAPVNTVAGRTGAVVIASTDISDSTVYGRTLFTAASVAAQRTALGLGGAALLATGTGVGQVPVVQSNGKISTSLIPAGATTVNSITDATSLGKAILLTSTTSAARTTLGLGTAATANTGTGAGAVPVLDSGGHLSTAVIPTNLTVTLSQVSNVTSIGIALGTAGSAAAARSTLGLGTASTHDVPASGNASSTQVVLGSDTRIANAINSVTATSPLSLSQSRGSNTADFTVASHSVTNTFLAPMATMTIKGNNTGSSGGPYDLNAGQVKTVLGLGTVVTYNTGTTSGTIPVLGSGGYLNNSVIPTNLTFLASQISNSTATGRSLITAANATAALTALGVTLGASANNVPVLDGSGKLLASTMPDIAISDFLGAAANQSAMLALTGQKGDWCTRTDTGQTFIITGTDPTQLGSWHAMSYPAAPVTTVAGRTGVITLSYSDISGLGTAAQANTGTVEGTIPLIGAGDTLSISLLPPLPSSTLTDATTAGLALLTAVDVAAQIVALGLGDMATQGANNVAISGGTIKDTYVRPKAINSGGIDSGTLLADVTSVNVVKVAMTENITGTGITGTIEDGQVVKWKFKQPASGGPYTIVLGSRFVGGTDVTLPVTASTDANAVDYMVTEYCQNTDKFHVLTFVRGYPG